MRQDCAVIKTLNFLVSERKPQVYLVLNGCDCYLCFLRYTSQKKTKDHKIIISLAMLVFPQKPSPFQNYSEISGSSRNVTLLAKQ